MSLVETVKDLDALNREFAANELLEFQHDSEGHLGMLSEVIEDYAKHATAEQKDVIDAALLTLWVKKNLIQKERIAGVPLHKVREEYVELLTRLEGCKRGFIQLQDALLTSFEHSWKNPHRRYLEEAFPDSMYTRMVQNVREKYEMSPGILATMAGQCKGTPIEQKFVLAILWETERDEVSLSLEKLKGDMMSQVHLFEGKFSQTERRACAISTSQLLAHIHEFIDEYKQLLTISQKNQRD